MDRTGFLNRGKCGDSRSTFGRGPSLVGSIDSSCWYKRFLSCLGCPRRVQYKTFFSTLATCSLAGQTVMPHYLSLNKCLWVVGTCSLAGQAVVPHYLSLNKCLWVLGTCSLAWQAVMPHYLSIDKCLWMVGTCSLAGQAVVPHYLSLNKCL